MLRQGAPYRAALPGFPGEKISAKGGGSETVRLYNIYGISQNVYPFPNGGVYILGIWSGCTPQFGYQPPFGARGGIRTG